MGPSINHFLIRMSCRELLRGAAVADALRQALFDAVSGCGGAVAEV
jgi:hypothetical protein